MEGKDFACNWKLILAKAPKVKGVCHFAIKDILLKEVNHYFSVMFPQWKQTDCFLTLPK